MSGMPACQDTTHRHVVTVRKANYSAFSGYHYTPSDWSEIRCVATGQRWRSKSAHVDRLPDATPLDVEAADAALSRG